MPLVGRPSLTVLKGVVHLGAVLQLQASQVDLAVFDDGVRAVAVGTGVEALIALDAANPQWQRDLSVIHEWGGDILPSLPSAGAICPADSASLSN